MKDKTTCPKCSGGEIVTRGGAVPVILDGSQGKPCIINESLILKTNTHHCQSCNHVWQTKEP